MINFCPLGVHVLSVRSLIFVDIVTVMIQYPSATLQHHKWENAMTIDAHSWGFRRNSILSDYLPIENLVWQLVSTVR